METKFCEHCGKEIAREAEICPACRSRVTAGQISTSTKNTKNEAHAAVLSFIWPGLGQIYNGQIGKGLCLGLPSLAFIALAIVTILVLAFTVISAHTAYQMSAALQVIPEYKEYSVGVPLFVILFGLIGIPSYIIVVAYSTHDAYNTAKKINAGAIQA